MKDKVLQNAKKFLLPALLLVVIVFTEQTARSKSVPELKVRFTNSHSTYVTEDEIISRLENLHHDELIGKAISQIDLNELDSTIESSPFVKTSSGYVGIDGTLYLSLKQERPILRIINSNNQSFYLNENGDKMPLSRNYTPRVPICTGNITELVHPTDSITSKLVKDLYKVALYIDKERFFYSITGQILVNKNNEIVLITKMEEKHQIILGDASNLTHKFQNLKEFYTKVLPNKGWNSYSTINLKFKNQIIAKK